MHSTASLHDKMGFTKFIISLMIARIVVATQGPLDLSAPVYTIRYQSYHINVFRAPSETSDPVFYYTPACILLPNVTKIIPKDPANPLFLTIKISLWDEDYIRNIIKFISASTTTENPVIRPISLNWIRVDSIDSNHVKQKWKSIVNHPRTVSLRFRCLTTQECEELEEVIKTDSEHFATSMQLAFAYRAPNITKLTINPELEHLQNAATFSLINEYFPDANYIFIQKSDFTDLVRETITKGLETALESDEFVDDEQMEELIKQVAVKLRHNMTSTDEFTEAMWKNTFWHEEHLRPDVKAKHLQTLFSNGMRWAQRLMSNGTSVGDMGAFGTAEALEELKYSKGPVQWDGERIVIKPFKMYCISLTKLRENVDFGSFSVRITKSAADYYTIAHSPGRLDAVDSGTNDRPKDGQSERVSTESQLNETVASLVNRTLESRIQSLKQEVLEQLINSTTEKAIFLESLFSDAVKQIAQLEENTTKPIRSANNYSTLVPLAKQAEPRFNNENGSIVNHELMDKVRLLENRQKEIMGNVTELKQMFDAHSDSMAVLTRSSTVTEMQLQENADKFASLLRNESLLRNNLEELSSRVDIDTDNINLAMTNQTVIFKNRINVVERVCEENSRKVTTITSRANELSNHLQAISELTESALSVAQNCNAVIDKLERAAVPVGSIIAFPAYSVISSCWLECNGQFFSSSVYPKLFGILGSTAAPNLKGRFLLGRNHRYSVGSTGGEAQHTLTTDEMPSHNHGAAYGGSFLDMDGKFGFARYSRALLGNDKIDTNMYTAHTGRDKPHNNMPPYQAVIFFIRAC